MSWDRCSITILLLKDIIINLFQFLNDVTLDLFPGYLWVWWKELANTEECIELAFLRLYGINQLIEFLDLSIHVADYDTKSKLKSHFNTIAYILTFWCCSVYSIL